MCLSIKMENALHGFIQIILFSRDENQVSDLELRAHCCQFEDRVR